MLNTNHSFLTALVMAPKKVYKMMPWLKNGNGRHMSMYEGYMKLLDKFTEEQVFRYLEYTRLHTDLKQFAIHEERVKQYFNSFTSNVTSNAANRNQHPNRGGRCQDCHVLNEIGNNAIICNACHLKQELSKRSSYFANDFVSVMFK